MDTRTHTTAASPIDSVGQRLYQEAKRLIPGGTQLLSKRPEMFAPQQWPPYYRSAKGCQTVDLDGKTYTDFSGCGIGATLLGYADPDVTAAVIKQVQDGAMCTLNPPHEVELAKLLCQLHPWAQMVRLGRLGGESMVIAVRIARARTRRDKVAFCGYHGWHDWYLSANLPVGDETGTTDRLGQGHLLKGLEPAGVPRGLAGTAMPFAYNQIDQLKAITDRHGSELAAIVLEPSRSAGPKDGFLHKVRQLADDCGAQLIMDEISIGWRICCGGAHMTYGIEPDIAVFSKTTGNGHPISAVIGNADTMQAAQDTFISSALWTEAVGPAAGVATVTKFMREDVSGHVARIGQRTADGIDRLARTHQLPLTCGGHHRAMTAFLFDHPQAAAIQTLWTVRMLAAGFLVGGSFLPTWAHQNEHVDAFIEACDPVFAEISQAIKAGDVLERIGGPVKHAGFTRLT